MYFCINFAINTKYLYMNRNITRKNCRRHLVRKFLTLFFLLFTISAFAAEDQDRFVVIIDAGHGGRDSGSINGPDNAYEKEITLSIAKKLGEQLKKKINNCEVRYTREKDKMMGLKERADYANKMKGNLFISLHLNSGKNPDEAGFKAYILDKTGDANGLQQAQKENSAMLNESNYKSIYGDFNPQKEDFSKFDMPELLNYHLSKKFAENSKQKMAAMGRPSLGVSRGPFWLLSAVNMPGAVLELGFVSNPEERKFLMSKKGQDKMALALSNAIVDYVSYFRNTDFSKVELEQPKPAVDNSALNFDSSDNTDVRSHNPESFSRKNPSARRKRRTKVVAEDGLENLSNAGFESETVSDDGVSGNSDTPLVVIGDDDSGIEVAGSGGENAVKVQQPARKERTSSNRNHSKKQTVTKVYTILLYTSKDRLEVNNIAFKGIKPDSFIHENNVYKYTYGESEDKKQMEALLNEVRKSLPEAKIIQIRK